MKVFIKRKSVIIKSILSIVASFYALIPNIQLLIDHQEFSKWAHLNILLITMPILAIIINSIWRFEENHKAYKRHFCKKSLLPAFFISSLFTLCFNPFSIKEVGSFTGIISHATNNNFDIKSLTSSAILFFAVFAISFWLCLIWFNKIYAKPSKKQLRPLKTFTRFSIIASLSLVFSLFSLYSDISTNGFFLTIAPTVKILILVFLGYTLYFKSTKLQKITFDLYEQALILSILIGVIGGFSIAIFIISILVLVFLLTRKNKKISQTASRLISGGCISFSFFPLLLAILIESIYILNQHEVFVAKPRLIYAIIVAVLLAIAIGLSLYLKKRKKYTSNWKRIAFPALIIGIMSLSVQLSLQNEYSVDIFESANSSVLISDFLNFGKVPILEHYGGHMLKGFIGGTSYYALNGDYAGAILKPYEVYMSVVVCLLLFLTLKRLCDEDTAFWAVMTIPILTTFVNFYGLGLLLLLAMLVYFKKPNLGRAFLVSIAAVLCMLYRLDIGVPFIIAGASGALIYAFTKKAKIKYLFLASTITISVLFIAAIIISLLKGIDLPLRIKEFIAISASNQNWASSPTFGDANFLFYAWGYLFMPFAIFSSLIFIIFGNLKKTIKSESWLTLLILGISYLANLSRGMVRHNITEIFGNAPAIITWTGYLYLALFLSIILKNTRYLVPIYVGFSFVSILFVNNTLSGLNANYPIDTAYNKTSTAIEGWKNIPQEKVQRFFIKESDRTEIDAIESLLTPLLKPNDKFFDFINKSFMYSKLATPDPIYAAQTPGHLSGVFGQEAAIAELERQDISFVLMPGAKSTGFANSLDGVPNSLRYYKLAEYIYRKYTPLTGNDYADVWVRKDLQGEYKKQLSEKTNTNTTYDLKNLPIIWGEKDTKKSKNNPVATSVSTDKGLSVFQNNFDKEFGNYLLVKITAAQNETGSVSLGEAKESDFKEIVTYNFDIEAGEHFYLFRVSHDVNWYNSNINAVDTRKINGETEVKILNGD